MSLLNYYVVINFCIVNPFFTLKHYYSCGLSTANIEYSCPYTLKYNGSIHLKLEHIGVYKNILEELDIGDCLIKVKVKA